MKKISIIVYLLGAVLMAGCGSHKDKNKNISQGLLLNDSLKGIVSVDTVRQHPLVDELILNGKVDFNQNRVARVSTMFGGTVTFVHGELGDYVTKGTVLAIVRSGDVAEYGKQREEASQQILLAKHNLSVTKDMFASGMSSQKDLLEAKQDLSNAKANLKRINEIYSIYHISSNADYSVKAPVSGFIVQRNVNPLMQIRPEDGPIFTISGLSDVWVTANVYESDIRKIHQGMPVKITTLAYPDREFTGKIDKVNNMLDEDSKTMSVRVLLENKQYLLKPGMLANVCVEDRQGGAMPRIDSHCLVFENGKRFVVIVGNHNKLEKREVEVSKQSDSYAFISSGLQDGDLVINKNALLVYNALVAQ